MLKKEAPKWERTAIIRRSDNLCVGDGRPPIKFIPSFELNHEPDNIWEIMSYNYARRWFKEKEAMDAQLVRTMPPAIAAGGPRKKETVLKRRFVVRGALKRKIAGKSGAPKFCTPKRYAHIGSKLKLPDLKKMVEEKLSEQMEKSVQTRKIHKENDPVVAHAQY